MELELPVGSRCRQLVPEDVVVLGEETVAGCCGLGCGYQTILGKLGPGIRRQRLARRDELVQRWERCCSACRRQCGGGPSVAERRAVAALLAVVVEG